MPEGNLFRSLLSYALLRPPPPPPPAAAAAATTTTTTTTCFHSLGDKLIFSLASRN
jgi:hypothetical protein